MSLFGKIIEINKKLSYKFNERFPGFVYENEYRQILIHQIKKYIFDHSPHDKAIGSTERLCVLEVGGIDRPLLSKSPAFLYHGLDIEYREICHDIYDEFIVQSVEEPIPREYNLIISCALLEHVQNNRKSLDRCHAALLSGGVMMHYMPSKYHPYSIILQILGPRWQKKIIEIFRPEARDVTGYPAYFDCCSPGEMKSVLTSQGFHNITIIPFYRAASYFDFFFPLYIVIILYENLCRKFRLQKLCSGFIVAAEK